MLFKLLFMVLFIYLFIIAHQDKSLSVTYVKSGIVDFVLNFSIFCNLFVDILTLNFFFAVTLSALELIF